jgi:sulfur carrier protein
VKLKVNGEERELAEGSTVVDLLGQMTGPVAVERNGEVVPRKEHATTRLAEGDELEIVHFVGGG